MPLTQCWPNIDLYWPNVDHCWPMLTIGWPMLTKCWPMLTMSRRTRCLPRWWRGEWIGRTHATTTRTRGRGRRAAGDTVLTAQSYKYLLSYQNVEQINYYYTFYTFLSLSCKNRCIASKYKTDENWRTTSGQVLGLFLAWTELWATMQIGFGVLSSDIASEMTVCKSRRVTAPECPNIMCNVCPAHTLTTFIHTRVLSGESSIVRIRNPIESN